MDGWKERAGLSRKYPQQQRTRRDRTQRERRPAVSAVFTGLREPTGRHIADHVRTDSEGNFTVKSMEGMGYGLCLRNECFGLNPEVVLAAFSEIPHPLVLRKQQAIPPEN